MKKALDCSQPRGPAMRVPLGIPEHELNIDCDSRSGAMRRHSGSDRRRAQWKRSLNSLLPNIVDEGPASTGCRGSGSAHDGEPCCVKLFRENGNRCRQHTGIPKVSRRGLSLLHVRFGSGGSLGPGPTRQRTPFVVELSRPVEMCLVSWGAHPQARCNLVANLPVTDPWGVARIVSRQCAIEPGVR